MEDREGLGVVSGVGLDEGGEVPHGSTAAFGIWRLKIDLDLPEGKRVGLHERFDGVNFNSPPRPKLTRRSCHAGVRPLRRGKVAIWAQ